MTEFDWSPLIKNDADYRMLSEAVSDYYRGDWDDEIHDSFHDYVREVQRQSNQLHRICLSAQKMGDEMEALNIEVLEKTTETLWMEEEEI